MAGPSMKSMARISVTILSSSSTYTGSLLSRCLATSAVAHSKDSPQTFYFRDLQIEKTKQGQPKPDPDRLIFGHHFSDHMFECDWDAKTGWDKPKLVPVHDLKIHPGAKVLHYAAELFEGIKAYRGVDNRIRIFRPELNMKRMNRTAARASLPTFDNLEFLRCIEELVRLDQDWVPQSTTSSLYIRPTLIGTDPHLGVAQGEQAKLFVVTGPAGPYFATGFKPVKLFADPKYVRAAVGGTVILQPHLGIGQSMEAKIFVVTGPVGAYFPTGFKAVRLMADGSFVRAVPGGAGEYKMGSNYAPTIAVAKKAQAKGCQQVLWLYDNDEKLTEVGTMNIFALWTNENGGWLLSYSKYKIKEKELITPPLKDGIILPGVTRQSVLDLTREWNEFKVTEDYPTMSQLIKATKEGRLHEVFGTGTACIVCPVDSILYRKSDGQEQLIEIPTMKQKNPLMQRLWDAVSDIQYGRVIRDDWQYNVKC